MALITGLNIIITMIISTENKNLTLKKLNHIDTIIKPLKDKNIIKNKAELTKQFI